MTERDTVRRLVEGPIRLNETTMEEGAPTVDNTALTQGLSFGSEQAEDLIAAELRKRSERGLSADREAVIVDLLNQGEIATFEPPAPVQQSEHSRRNQEALRQREQAGSFEQKLSKLADAGWSRDDAVNFLVNEGLVDW